MKILKSLMLFVALSMVAAGTSAGPVNVNSADAQTLASELNGVGLKKAEAIVAYREANGEFVSADALVMVQGIGLATVEKNRDFILLSDAQ